MNSKAPKLAKRTELERLHEFAAVLTHNLKTPIASIKMITTLMQEASSLEEAHDIAAEMMDAVENMQDYYASLEDLYRAIREPEEPAVEVSLLHAVNDVLHAMKPVIDAKEAEVVVDFSAGSWIWFRELSLKSVLQNLISNAIKYSREGVPPRIELRSFSRGDILELQVKDNGQGIDLTKYGDKIFKLFETFSKNEDATGMGLFIVKNQVESLGGKISVSSKLGEGSTFFVEFMKAKD
jgi:signal transduction histidine kinase